MKTFFGALGSAIMAVLGFALFLLIVGGPYIVVATQEVSYKYTELGAFAAVPIFLLALLAGIVKPLRGYAGLVMYGCALLVALFLWVWSVIIVNALWGIVVVYIANFFLAIGAVLLAFVATLFTAHWSILGQLAVVAIIGFVMQAVASMYISNAESNEAS